MTDEMHDTILDELKELRQEVRNTQKMVHDVDKRLAVFSTKITTFATIVSSVVGLAVQFFNNKG